KTMISAKRTSEILSIGSRRRSLGFVRLSIILPSAFAKRLLIAATRLRARCRVAPRQGVHSVGPGQAQVARRSNGYHCRVLQDSSSPHLGSGYPPDGWHLQQSW